MVVVLVISVALVSLHLVVQRVLGHELLEEFPGDVVFDAELGRRRHAQLLQDVVPDDLPRGVLPALSVQQAV